jgi:predicted DNA-binding transcriptional regulator AlpA
MSEQQAMKFLSREDLQRLGIKYSNIHMLRLEAMGKMPKRVYLSPGRVAYIESEILDYLARCVAARG